MANFNVIRYAVGDAFLTLKLDGEFRLQGGMRPNVNAFTCSHVEFAKLGGNVQGVDGKLLFYYSNLLTPNITIGRQAIVDYLPLQYGAIDGGDGSFVPVTYRVMLADFRHRWVSPRGGALTMGEVNKEPFGPAESGTGQTDKNGLPVRSNSDLLLRCIKAMGYNVETIAFSESIINGAPQLTNLNWSGAHAPTELAKILAHCRCELVPRLNGYFQIVREGSGELPLNAGAAFTEAAAGLDHRDDVVLITSAPSPAIDTVELPYVTTDPDDTDANWQFVAFDSAENKWKALEEVNWIVAAAEANLTDLLANGFKNVAAIDQLYTWGVFRDIRLNPKVHPYGRILRQIVRVGDVSQRPFVEGTLVTSDHRDLIVAKMTRREARDLDDDGHVLNFGYGLPLLSLPTAFVEKPMPIRLAMTLYVQTLGDFKVTVTKEATQGTGDQTRLVYFTAGFRRAGDSVVALTVAETESARLLGAAVVSVPNLVLIREHGVDQNADDLKAQAAAIAPAYIARAAGAIRERQFAGFQGADLSGLLSEIRITQTPPKTVWRINSWHVPSSELYAGFRSIPGVAGSAATAVHPANATVPAAQAAAGNTGASQPITRLSAPDAPIVHRFDCFVAITGEEAGNELYKGKIVVPPELVDVSVGVAFTKDVRDAEVLVANILGKQAVGGLKTHLIPAEKIVQGFFAEKQSDGRLLIWTAYDAGGDLYSVTVDKDGGDDGSDTAAATYTYQVTSAAGDVILEHATPRQQRPLTHLLVGKTGAVKKTGSGYELWTVDEQPDFRECGDEVLE